MVKVFCDGADLQTMEKYASDPRIDGFTTNPSLMKKAGITNYRTFAQAVLKAIGEKPVSFEVLSDEWREMEKQAMEISDWGENVWVKIPITNTKGELSIDLIERLEGVRLNITAVMTYPQINWLAEVTHSYHIVSVFAGRIADTQLDPYNIVRYARANCLGQILWASPRQVFDVVSAYKAGADIITLQPALIDKLSLYGKDLEEYSLETVKQFFEDGRGIEF